MADFLAKYLPRHLQPWHSQPEQRVPLLRQLAAYAAIALMLPGGSVIVLVTLLVSAYRYLQFKTGGVS